MATSSSSSSTSPKKKEEEEENSDDHHDDNGSFVHVIVFCMVLLGIGAIAGYITFYLIFQEKCSELLIKSHQIHNESQAELQTKYLKTVDDLHHCEEESELKSELHEAQGRLQAQALLADKHQTLLEQHKKTLEQIDELQNSEKDSSTKIETLTKELQQLQYQLETSIKEKNEIEYDLNSKMSITNSNLKERVKENSKQRIEIIQCQRKVSLNEDKLIDMTKMLQQQNLASIRKK